MFPAPIKKIHDFQKRFFHVFTNFFLMYFPFKNILFAEYGKILKENMSGRSGADHQGYFSLFSLWSGDKTLSQETVRSGDKIREIFIPEYLNI